MPTAIYTSRKLEKTITNHINHSVFEGVSPLGKWNVTYFNVNRRKWWLVVNSETKFSFMLPNITVGKVKDINKIFTEGLCAQLNFEGIQVDLEKIKKIIGNIFIYPTDNDNDPKPTNNLCEIVNSSPTQMFKWASPHEVMSIKLKGLLLSN